jgi:Bacteriodetes cell division protein (FtsL-like)
MNFLQNIKDQYNAYGSWRDMLQDLSQKGLVKNLYFIFYCTFLALLYITVVHSNENLIRRIVETNKKVKELGWQYKDEKRKLMFITKESELSKLTSKVNIESSIEVPKKILTTQYLSK